MPIWKPSICITRPIPSAPAKPRTIRPSFPRIDEALQNSEAIVIVGPGNEKTLLLKHLKEDCVRTRRVKSTQRPVITRPTANHRVGTP